MPHPQTVPSDLRRIFPALSAGRFIQLDSARMHFIDAGRGEPIVCVHGNPTWSFYWRAVIDGLASTHRVVAVDHIGCGLSDKPRQYDYCLRQHVENLAQLIERLDLTDITLVVHDWGGPIGVGAALRFPHRIRRLVLTNTGCFPPPFVPLRILACRIPILGSAMIRGANLFARAAVTMASTRRGGLSHDALYGMLAPYDSWNNRIAIDRFVSDIPLSKRHRTWRELEAIEAGLTLLANKPSLLMWGMRDWCFRPECMDRLKSHFPAAQSVEFPEAGHYLMEDAADEVVAVLSRFVGAVSRPMADSPC